jgi:hypothetical protein
MSPMPVQVNRAIYIVMSVAMQSRPLGVYNFNGA